MPWSSFTQSEAFLGKAAENYFSSIYERPKISIGEQLDPNLNWRPTFHFRPNKYSLIAVESSPDKIYPEIFRISHTELVHIPKPVCVYCVCPEEVYLQTSNQKNAKELREFGYGLLTVDKSGAVIKKFGCIPLIQHLPESEFNSAIKVFHKVLRIKIKEAYESYNNNAGSGVKELTEIAEGLVNEFAKKAARKGFISNADANGGMAKILDKMILEPKFKKAIAAIGGIRSYYKEYRNTAHHAPKSMKDADKKYRDCLHGFREGLRKIENFRSAMKNIGI